MRSYAIIGLLTILIFSISPIRTEEVQPQKSKAIAIQSTPYDILAAINLMRHNPRVYARFLIKKFAQDQNTLRKVKEAVKILSNKKPMSPLGLNKLATFLSYQQGGNDNRDQLIKELEKYNDESKGKFNIITTGKSYMAVTADVEVLNSVHKLMLMMITKGTAPIFVDSKDATLAVDVGIAKPMNNGYYKIFAVLGYHAKTEVDEKMMELVRISDQDMKNGVENMKKIIEEVNRRLTAQKNVAVEKKNEPFMKK